MQQLQCERHLREPRDADARTVVFTESGDHLGQRIVLDFRHTDSEPADCDVDARSERIAWDRDRNGPYGHDRHGEIHQSRLHANVLLVDLVHAAQRHNANVLVLRAPTILGLRRPPRITVTLKRNAQMQRAHRNREALFFFAQY